MRDLVCAILVTSFCGGSLLAQTDTPRTAKPDPAPVDSIPLAVPAGTPLQVVLDQEVRIHKAGQAVHGKIAVPVYAFDKIVIPAGSEVLGKVSEIKAVSPSRRTLAALNADFSPAHSVQVEFDELVLPTGQHIPLQTVVTPGSQGVLQFVPAADVTDQEAKAKKNPEAAAKKAASQKVSETRQEISRDWQTAKQQFTAPGKMHRLERFALAELPYHEQYLEAGTRFNAELRRPLDFGAETLAVESTRAIGQTPPPGSVVHALLITALNSAETQVGAPVEAVITEPLFASNQLILPEGSRLKGTVLQVQRARRLHRNGQLRIVFHEIVPPNAAVERVEASLEGVEVKDGERLNLDSEGGAKVTTPKTRYLTTGISVALAASSFNSDTERGVQSAGGDAGGRAVNGAVGFRIVGVVMGALVHSRALASGMGVYGASVSVYDHFLARGRDVVYPKDTAMVVGFGSRLTHPAKSKDKASPGSVASSPLN